MTQRLSSSNSFLSRLNMSEQQFQTEVMSELQYREERHKELLKDSTTYCCYCGLEQGERWHCCGENHFESYAEMSPDTQAEILDSEVAWWEYKR